MGAGADAADGLAEHEIPDLDVEPELLAQLPFDGFARLLAATRPSRPAVPREVGSKGVLDDEHAPCPG